MIRRAMVVASALVLLAAGCGSDGDDGAGPTTTAGATDATAAPTTTGGSDGATTTAPGDTTAATAEGDQTGPADDSLEPVIIGLLNQENVPGLSFPESRESVEAVAEYINAERGGINGHPVVIESCVNASPEEAQSCAQELASIDGIHAITLGVNVFVSGFDMYGTFGDIPVVGGTPLFDGDFAAPTARYFYGGSLSVFSAMAAFAAEDLGAQNVAILQQDGPAGAAAIAPIEQVFAITGTDFEVILLPTEGGDATAQVTQAQGADAILMLGSKDTCGPVIQAVDLLGVPKDTVVHTGTCNDDEVLDAVGELAVGSHFHTTGYTERTNNAPDDKQAEIATREEAFDQYAPDIARGAFASVGAQAMFNIEQLFEEIGFESLTPEGILATMDDGTARASWATTDYQCPTLPEFPAVCGADNFFPQLEEDLSVTLGEPVNGLAVIAAG
ncbi:MAG: ABC transporter substrate-binding protein [Acidimicrobiia bacterium]|nr:ABC transporter substrate-binding protein [Acidimicrobiia bacterium]